MNFGFNLALALGGLAYLAGMGLFPVERARGVPAPAREGSTRR
jgi:hypothetical protein